MNPVGWFEAERRTSHLMGTHPRFGISHFGTNEAFGHLGGQNAQGGQGGTPHPIRDACSSPTGDERAPSRPAAIPASGGAPSPPPRPGPGRGPFPGAEGGRRGRAAARRGRAGPLGAGGERSRGGRQRQRQGQRQRAGRGRPPAWPDSRQPAPAAPRASYASRPGAKMKGRDGSGASAHVQRAPAAGRAARGSAAWGSAGRAGRTPGSARGSAAAQGRILPSPRAVPSRRLSAPTLRSPRPRLRCPADETWSSPPAVCLFPARRRAMLRGVASKHLAVIRCQRRFSWLVKCIWHIAPRHPPTGKYLGFALHLLKLKLRFFSSRFSLSLSPWVELSPSAG